MFSPILDEAGLNETVKAVLFILKEQAKHQRVKFKFDPLKYNNVAKIDKTRVQQVVINLVTNALKFSVGGSIINIKMT